MRRLSLWMRAHPMFGDTVITVFLTGLTLLEAFQGWSELHWFWYWLVSVLLLLPLVFRRRYPVLTADVIAVGGLVQLLTHGNDGTGMPTRAADLALGVALYTLLVYADRRRALAYAGVLLLGTAACVLWRFSDARNGIGAGIGAMVVFGFCWVLGEFVGARRAYHAEVEARLKLLETERDQHAKIAVAQERARIARELHDVVAHAVSVIVVQADGAGYAIHTDPDLAVAATRTIANTGREALIELRRLLAVLRDTSSDNDERSPQPDVSGLPDLAEKVTAVGLPVKLTVHGHVADLPAGVGLSIYRIVQEALTNTLKHAGPGASATVRVERVGGLVEVEVTDDGLGTPHHLMPVSGGNGLIGMRERATVLGGTLIAGQGPGGGWRVRATFPVREPDHPASAEPLTLPSDPGAAGR